MGFSPQKITQMGDDNPAWKSYNELCFIILFISSSEIKPARF